MSVERTKELDFLENLFTEDNEKIDRKKRFEYATRVLRSYGMCVNLLRFIMDEKTPRATLLVDLGVKTKEKNEKNEKKNEKMLRAAISEMPNVTLLSTQRTAIHLLSLEDEIPDSRSIRFLGKIRLVMHRSLMPEDSPSISTTSNHSRHSSMELQVRINWTRTPLHLAR